MATVPIQTAPTTRVATDTGRLGVNRMIQPRVDDSGDSDRRLGVAMMAVGREVEEARQRMQALHDDARGKDLYNQYASFADRVETEYLQLEGQAARVAFGDVADRLQSHLEELAAETENDTQRLILTQAGAVRQRTAMTTITRHSIGEIGKYELDQTKKRAAGYVRDAQTHWRDPAERAKYLEAALREVRAVAEKSGNIDEHGNVQAGDLELAVHTDVHAFVARAMMHDAQMGRGTYADAAAYIEQAWQAGELDEQVYSRMRDAAEIAGQGEKAIQIGEKVYQKVVEDGTGSLEEILEAVDAATDDLQMRADALQYISDRRKEALAIEEERYVANLRDVIKAADAHVGPGGWKEIDAEKLAILTPQDLRRVKQGPPRDDDPQAVLELELNPQLWKPGSIEKYWHALKPEIWTKYATQGAGPDAAHKILAAEIDNDYLQRTLLQMEMDNLVRPKPGSKEADDLIELRWRWKDAVLRAEQAKGARIDDPAKEDILVEILKDQIFIDRAFGFRAPLPVAAWRATAKQLRAGYVELVDSDGTRRRVYPADIEVQDNEERDAEAYLRRRGEPYATQAEIVQRVLDKRLLDRLPPAERLQAEGKLRARNIEPTDEEIVDLLRGAAAREAIVRERERAEAEARAAAPAQQVPPPEGTDWSRPITSRGTWRRTGGR